MVVRDSKGCIPNLHRFVYLINFWPFQPVQQTINTKQDYLASILKFPLYAEIVRNKQTEK